MKKKLLYDKKKEMTTMFKWTRMTKFKEAQLKKSDDQTNIDKYRVDANNTEYHILLFHSSEESSFQNSFW